MNMFTELASHCGSDSSAGSVLAPKRDDFDKIAQTLLREYLDIALDNLGRWDAREGDEADFMLRNWQRKVNQIRAML